MARPFSKLRVFFALWPDASARDRLAALAENIAARTGGRAPPAANLHVTLAFVGDVPIERVAALAAIGAAVSATATSFALTLDCTGTFRRTGITWVGARRVPPSLDALAGGLTAALAADDFPIEQRPYTPHVTLARRCETPAVARLSARIRWMVRRVVLNASQPAPGGSRYLEIAAWPLGASAGADGAPRRSSS